MLNEIERQLPELQKFVSRKEVPLLVGFLADKSKFSVCWFRSLKCYKVFHPFLDFSVHQTVKKFDTPQEVRMYIENLNSRIDPFYPCDPVVEQDVV